MEKTARIYNLNDNQQACDTLAYWHSRPPAESIAAVERLRRHQHGPLPRLQSVIRIIQQDQPGTPDFSTGRQPA